MDLSEKDILEDLRTGNEQVFEGLFRTYYERLCNYAFGFVGDETEAEEMVQEVFVKIWKKHQSINIHTSVKSYLYSAVHNNCLNRLKQIKVHREHGEYYKQELNKELGDASQNLIADELDNMLKAAIDALPQQCRKVFKLSRYEQLTYSEIAQKMNISVKTVENHMIKVLKILREKFKDYLPVIILLLLMFRN